MSRFNKLWVALGLGLGFVALKHYDLVPLGFDSIVVDTISAALVAWGVYQVPNANNA